MTQKEQTVNNEYELITQKDQQRIRELTLMDDDFMTKCFDGDNESIELISAACGFRDVKYFSRVIKAYFGCTPTELRSM